MINIKCEKCGQSDEIYEIKDEHKCRFCASVIQLEVAKKEEPKVEELKKEVKVIVEKAVEAVLAKKEEAPAKEELKEEKLELKKEVKKELKDDPKEKGFFKKSKK
jgi:hypothetical protein